MVPIVLPYSIRVVESDSVTQTKNACIRDGSPRPRAFGSAVDVFNWSPFGDNKSQHNGKEIKTESNLLQLGSLHAFVSQVYLFR